MNDKLSDANEKAVDPKTKTLHEKLLLQIRPAFGGNIIATIVNYDWWPQMATVREGVMPLLEPDPSRLGEKVDESVSLDDVPYHSARKRVPNP